MECIKKHVWIGGRANTHPFLWGWVQVNPVFMYKKDRFLSENTPTVGGEESRERRTDGKNKKRQSRESTKEKEEAEEGGKAWNTVLPPSK
jgi:hypothetical protein